MDRLYQSAWGDTSCFDQALQTVSVGLAILPAIMLVVGVLVWLPFRSKPAESRLVRRLLTSVTVLLIVVITLWSALFHQQLREVRFGAAGFEVTSCAGVRQRNEFHPADSVTSIRHRLGRTGGKSPVTIDQVEVVFRDAGPLILPVNEIGNFDLDVLRRSLPQPVFRAWADALRARNRPVPEWLERQAR